MPNGESLITGLEWVEGLGAWSYLVITVAYIVGSIAMFPSIVITTLAGFLFGIGKGMLAAWIASVLGAVSAFLVGRYVARDWVAEQIKQRPRLRALDRAVGENGFKIVVLTRLSPVFPFNFLNYAYALTNISVRDYFMASLVGMIPGTIFYVSVGAVAKDLTMLVSGEATLGNTWIKTAMLGLGVLATLAVTIVVARLAKEALRESLELEDEDEDALDDLLDGEGALDSEAPAASA
jgi:uncharacterized membrane protein YdjX (TVP38/TMEM64 family)